MKLVEITQELIEAGQSGNGGWTREQLKLIGVSWPPLKGWRRRVVGLGISEADAQRFVELKGRTLKRQNRNRRENGALSDLFV